MDMNTKAVFEAAQTKIDAALKEVNNPVLEISLITSTLASICLKWSGGSWVKAIQLSDMAAATCRHSMEAARKVFGDKAFKKGADSKA